ncbi:hypothetical protein SAMN05660284_00195 [Formivibrio citricus]|uniref:Uncharacterized protein n=1 Tax=Formivibrio citricus TaxID=83765 RepID=A0A1I4VAC9_9NEIS|nr:hypothetical protein SAMN05660284_00195 [Formivibrio citricus]
MYKPGRHAYRPLYTFNIETWIKKRLHTFRIYLNCVTENSKRIIANTRYNSTSTETPLQTPGNCIKQQIAVVVSKHIIYFSKLVHIKQRNNLRNSAFRQGSFNGLNKITSVGQIENWVDIGQIAQLLDQFDIIATDGDVGTKDFKQVMVNLSQRYIAVYESSKITQIVPGKKKYHVVFFNQIAMFAQATSKAIFDPWFVNVSQTMSNQSREHASGC